MIVNWVKSGWEVIYHQAHALLAAQLAGHWDQNQSPIRLYETIAAIAHHDDLEREWEGDHLTETGAPLDFKLSPAPPSVEELTRHTDNARYRGRWVSLLISKHMTYLYEPMRQDSPEMASFLDEQHKRQEQWQKDLDLTPEAVDEAYTFFRWCDRLSLILCQRQIPEGERTLEIIPGHDGKRYDVVQQSDGRLTVHPWPFAEPEFTVNVEAAYLSQMTFESQAELTAALQTAPIEILEWTFAKPD